MNKISKIGLILSILRLSVSLNANDIKYEEIKSFGTDNDVINSISVLESPINKDKNNGEFKFYSCSGKYDNPMIPQLFNTFYIDVEGDNKIEYKVAIDKNYFSKCDNLKLEYIITDKKGNKGTYTQKVYKDKVNEFTEINVANKVVFLKK